MHFFTMFRVIAINMQPYYQIKVPVSVAVLSAYLPIRILCFVNFTGENILPFIKLFEHDDSFLTDKDCWEG